MAQANTSNWQSSYSSPIERLSHLLISGEMSDVIFKFHGDQASRQPLKAHSLVLSMTSAVFQSMFFGPLKHGKNANDEFEIEIHDDPVIFEQLIKYIYSSDSVEFTDMESALKLHLMADKYMLEDVKKHCERELANLANTFKDAMKILPYALLENREGLRNIFKTVLYKEDDIVAQIGLGCVDVELDELKYILFNIELKATEVSIFKAVYNWALLRSKPDTAGADTRVKFLSTSGLLRAIDFSKMTKLELQLDVLPRKVITKNQIEMFLKNDKESIPDALFALPTLPRRRPMNQLTGELCIRVPFTNTAVRDWHAQLALTPDATIVLFGFKLNYFREQSYQLFLLGDENEPKTEENRIFTPSHESLSTVFLPSVHLFPRDVKQILFFENMPGPGKSFETFYHPPPSKGRLRKGPVSGDSLYANRGWNHMEECGGGGDLPGCSQPPIRESCSYGNVCSIPVTYQLKSNTNFEITLFFSTQIQ